MSASFRHLVTLLAGGVLACGDAATGLPPGHDVGPALSISRLPDSNTPFTYYSGLVEPAQAVIRSDAEWTALWGAIHAPVTPAPPAPAIDFSTDMVLLAALGQRLTGATYSLIIERVFEAADGAVDVVIRENRLGDDCVVAAVVTTPVDLALVPRREGVVRFWRRVAVNDC